MKSQNLNVNCVIFILDLGKKRSPDMLEYDNQDNYSEKEISDNTCTSSPTTFEIYKPNVSKNIHHQEQIGPLQYITGYNTPIYSAFSSNAINNQDVSKPLSVFDVLIFYKMYLEILPSIQEKLLS